MDSKTNYMNKYIEIGSSIKNTVFDKNRNDDVVQSGGPDKTSDK